jgi:hypothetical protein
MLLTMLAMLTLADQPDTERQRAAAEAAAEAAAAAVRAAAEASSDGTHTGGAVYDPARNADADVAAAVERARASGRMVMIVLGGNWCHDSRGLAEHFAEPDFQTMLSQRYEIVYVDVGHRDRNLQIPARYGVNALQGTPTVLILSPEGQLLNRGTASSWRNAASRGRANIFAHFQNFRRTTRP